MCELWTARDVGSKAKYALRRLLSSLRRQSWLCGRKHERALEPTSRRKIPMVLVDTTLLDRLAPEVAREVGAAEAALATAGEWRAQLKVASQAGDSPKKMLATTTTHLAPFHHEATKAETSPIPSPTPMVHRERRHCGTRSDERRWHGPCHPSIGLVYISALWRYGRVEARRRWQKRRHRGERVGIASWACCSATSPASLPSSANLPWRGVATRPPGVCVWKAKT